MVPWFSINIVGSARVRPDPGCRKCELDKSVFSATSPHKPKREIVLLFLYFKHTQVGGRRVKCCEEEESSDGNVLLFYLSFATPLQSLLAFYIFPRPTKRHFPFSKHQLSTLLNNAMASLTGSLSDQMKLLKPAGS